MFVQIHCSPPRGPPRRTKLPPPGRCGASGSPHGHLQGRPPPGHPQGTPGHPQGTHRTTPTLATQDDGDQRGGQSHHGLRSRTVRFKVTVLPAAYMGPLAAPDLRCTLLGNELYPVTRVGCSVRRMSQREARADHFAESISFPEAGRHAVKYSRSH